jgi:hypothetical protein
MSGETLGDSDFESRKPFAAGQPTETEYAAITHSGALG